MSIRSGGIDVFRVLATDIGTLGAVRVRVQSVTDEPTAWRLDLVSVRKAVADHSGGAAGEEAAGEGEEAWFECYKWLGTAEPHAVRQRELRRAARPVVLRTYSISVETASQAGAGSDGPVRGGDVGTELMPTLMPAHMYIYTRAYIHVCTDVCTLWGT